MPHMVILVFEIPISSSFLKDLLISYIHRSEIRIFIFKIFFSGVSISVHEIYLNVGILIDFIFLGLLFIFSEEGPTLKISPSLWGGVRLSRGMVSGRDH